MTLTASLVIFLVGLAASAFLAALQMSLRWSGRGALEALADRKGSPKLRARIDAIVGDLNGHAAAVALPRTIATLLVAVAAVFLVAAMKQVDHPGVVSVVVGTLGAGLLLWLLGVVVPQSVSSHAAERTVCRWSGLIRAVYIAVAPVRGAVDLLDEIVRRLAGESDIDEDEALEAGLRSVVEEGEGRIDESAREMIEAVVDFATTTVEQIMTPRTEVTSLEHTDDLDTVMAFLAGAGHSRVPIHRDNLDHVDGILYAKDLLHWLASEEAKGDAQSTFRLSAILRPVTFVPETKTIRELLAELMANRVHIAMVADEYGGTSGLVTIEDIVEEIFGEIRDEYELEDEDTASVDIDPKRRVAVMEARTEIDDANDQLEAIGLELPEHEDYDTVGGFVTVTLGRIPAAGEVLRHEGVVVTVLEAEATRVTKVRIEPADGGTPEAAGAELVNDADRVPRESA